MDPEVLLREAFQHRLDLPRTLYRELSKAGVVRTRGPRYRVLQGHRDITPLRRTPLLRLRRVVAFSTIGWARRYREAAGLVDLTLHPDAPKERGFLRTPDITRTQLITGKRIRCVL